MLKGKTIVLGITGGIAAYKIAPLASMLVKAKANVYVIMTENAGYFIGPHTFEALTGNRCITDTFDRNHEYSVEHIALAKKADLFLVAPATANVIGKMAHGIADDMLTTTLLATKAPIFVAPAMNTGMYENKIVQRNLRTLQEDGVNLIEPTSGYLACGDVGAGKMVEPEKLFEHILHAIANEKDMNGIKVLITAGPTLESIDPVRYISNHSTGKMGYALAKNCARRGADVVLVSGPTNMEPPLGCEFVAIKSAKEMCDEVLKRHATQDIIIKAAAVADYRPRTINNEKVKKKEGDLSIPLERTQDILKTLGAHKKEGQFLCGFSMETENLIENSTEKLAKKNLDMIVANNLKEKGAGFGVDTNVVTLITASEKKQLPLMSKEAVAQALIDEILEKRK